MVHTINLAGYSAAVQGANLLQLGTWNSYGIEQLQINAGPEWTGLTITATFVTPNSSTRVVVPTHGLIDVPPEATAQTLTIGNPGCIVFAGVSDGVQRISTNIYYTVANHAPVEGSDSQPTPSEWEQFVAQVQQSAQQAAQSESNAAAGATAAASSAADAAAELRKVQGAGNAALQEIGDAQTAALGAVQGAQNTATQAVQQVGQTAAQQVQQTGTAQEDAVNKAGDAKLQQIADINALLPTPTETDAGKAVVVSHDGSGYELGDVQVDAYTKAESDARYAPIEAAIKVSGNGAGLVSLSPTVAWGMQGLKLYGRSWQDGTPSVETEAPIQDAGQSGQVDLTVCGTNLFDKSSMVVNGYIGADKFFTLSSVRSILVPCAGNAAYTITKAAGKHFVAACLEADSLNNGDTLTGSVYNDAGTSITITTTAKSQYLVAYVWQSGVDTISEDEMLSSIMVDAGDTSEPYQPYTAQQLPIPTPNGLPGIPVDSGGNWTDENGQQWVSDVVDLAAGTHKTLVSKRTISEVTNLTSFRQTDENYWGCECPILQNDLKGYSVAGALCSINAFSGIANYINGDQFTIIRSNGYIVFGIPRSIGATRDEINAYLANHPIEIAFALATPITTPLDAETIAAYKAMQTCPGTTNIIVPDCGIEASAVGDATQIIANITDKIAVLESAATGI